MKRLFIVICLFIWMPIPAMGGWFGPSNYEECILENMKGVASDKAVQEIRKACRAKFPKKPIKEPAKKPKLRDVPKKVLKDITGKAWFEDKTHTDALCEYNFYAMLHNDNAKWTITEVKIRITDKATGTYEDVLDSVVSGSQEGGFLTDDDVIWDEDYSDFEGSEDLSPFKSKRFPFFVKKVPAKWEWTIVEAKGYREPFLFFF